MLAQTSIIEGGANAVSEALSSGVPVVASDIPGNVGMLGEDYPGYYEAGDEDALAQLLYRAETDVAFYETLRDCCEARRHLVLPEREKAALGSLVIETLHNEAEGYNRVSDRSDAMKISSLYDVGRVFKPCAQPHHLRRTFTIALIVGSWLTLFNQGEVLASGQLDSVLLLKVFLNYLTPFVVANFGLISAEKTNETTERARPKSHCPPGAKKDR